MAKSAKDLIREDYDYAVKRREQYKAFHTGAVKAQEDALAAAREQYDKQVATIKGNYDESMEIAQAQVERFTALVESMPVPTEPQSPNFK